MVLASPIIPSLHENLFKIWIPENPVFERPDIGLKLYLAISYWEHKVKEIQAKRPSKAN